MTEDSTIPSLAEYLAQIPEYRAARGLQHPLLALLLLVCVAMLCGARGQSAIADWGQHHGRPWLRRLGFTRDRAPSQPTLSRLFRGIPHRAVEAALGRWAEQVVRCCPAAGELEGVALDGKTLRGSKRQGAADAHLLAAFSHRRGVVLGQVGVADKTNELGAAQAFLLTVALEGRIVTADALLTQRELARTILASGGDYLLAVKANQPQLRADLAAAFAPDADGTGLVGTACTVTQHGGRVERRTLTASTAPVGYSDWPGLQQALRLERRVIHKATRAAPAPGDRLRDHLLYATARRARPIAPPLARPLGDREPAALYPRRGLRRGSRHRPRRPRPAGHGPPSATPPSASSMPSASPGSPPPAAASAPSPLAAFLALGPSPDLE